MNDSTLYLSGGGKGSPDGSVPDDYLTWGQIRSLLRRRWPILLLFIVLGAGGAWYYGARAARVYEATAVLQLEKDQYNLPEMVTNHATDEGELSTELEVLQSSSLIADVVRDLALNVKPRDTREPRSRLFFSVNASDRTSPGTLTLTRTSAGQYLAQHSATGEQVDSIRAGAMVTIGGMTFAMHDLAGARTSVAVDIIPFTTAVQTFKRQLKVGRGDRNANIIWLRYRSGDPELTSAAAEFLARHYIDRRVEVAREKVRMAVRYLREEADTLHRQMQQADMALHDFRQREGVVSLADEASSAVVQSAQLRTARATIEAERSALQQLVNQADTGAVAYRRLTAFPTLIGNPVVANLLRSVESMEGERTTLLLQRTPRDPDVQAIARRINETDSQLRGMTLTYLAGLQKQVASLDQALSAQHRLAATIPGKSMEEDQLSRAPKVLADVYTLVATRLQEARLAESAATPGVVLIGPPDVPVAPVWPRRGLLLAVGILVGLLIGLAVAWAREGLDVSIHSRADVARAAELPVLTVVPHIRHNARVREAPAQSLVPLGSGGGMRQLPPWRPPTGTVKTADLQSFGALREAYTWLETNLAMTHAREDGHLVAITSAMAREGKTISATNLALSAAQHGRRVLLIDADLRQGSVHEVLGIARAPGLSEVLRETARLQDVVQTVRVDGDGSVDVLCRGQRPQHPTALLKSSRLPALLAQARADHDLVIIDLPPVNLVSDPLLLSRLVDGVVLVARAGLTDADALAEATRHLRESGAPLLGVLLNDINLQRDSSYDASYRYLDQAGAYASAGEV